MHSDHKSGNQKEMGYTLEDIIQQNKKYPRHFMKPTAQEIDSLQPGDEVKLIFLFPRPLENGCSGERMWVVIDSINGDNFVGILENDPCFLATIKAGDKIEFQKKNIASVITPAPDFDPEKFAIITKRAFENREINYVVRGDDLCNEKDSGWQLFYGDEDDDYLENTDNAMLITLHDVLNFEPLLEYAFIENGRSYEYNEEHNAYEEAE